MASGKSQKYFPGNCLLFDGISEEETAALLEGRAQYQDFERDEVIYSPESYRRCLGIIIKGRAAVENNGALLNQLRCGDCFGAAALFTEQQTYITTVRAKTACRVLFLTMEDMQELILRQSQIALNYIRFLSGRIQFLNRRIDSFTAATAEETLLSYLSQQPNRRSEGVPMAKLAEILNIGRTSLYRAVQRLEDEGRIRRSGKSIELI